MKILILVFLFSSLNVFAMGARNDFDSRPIVTIEDVEAEPAEVQALMASAMKASHTFSCDSPGFNNPNANDEIPGNSSEEGPPEPSEGIGGAVGPVIGAIGGLAMDPTIGAIVNAGQAVWTLIEAGKPSRSFQVASASAVPSANACWTSLENWARPKAKLLKVQYRNKLGMNVIDMQIRVSYLHGGQVDGKGAFLAEVKAKPAKVQVAWGFNLDAKVSIPTVVNLGTSEDPTAGMQVEIDWAVDTVVQSTKASAIVFVDGDGGFELL